MAVSDGDSADGREGHGPRHIGVRHSDACVAHRPSRSRPCSLFDRRSKLSWQNAQPVYRPLGRRGFALGHNGNLTNVAALEASRNMLPGVLGSDSDLVAELLEEGVSPSRRTNWHRAASPG